MLKVQNDLSDLTIIIPTYERKFFLIRQIKYLSTWNVNLIIADGSREELSYKELSELKKFKKFDYFNNHKSYVNRVGAVAENIKTKFVMCLADDDFYLKSGVQEAINSLILNEDAIACMGQAVGLDRIFNKYYTFPYGNNLRNYNIDQETPSQRIEYGLTDYRSVTPYAVFRTPAFKYVWQTRSDVSCLEVVEYENCIKTLQQGKVITAKAVYWVRSFEAYPIASEIDGTRKTDFREWYTSNKYINEINLFKKRVTTSLIGTNKISATESNFIYESTIEKILLNSHSSLVENDTIIKVYNSISLMVNSSPMVTIIKKSKIWINVIRPLITFGLRRKIHTYSTKINYDKNELNGVLNFCENFYIK